MLKLIRPSWSREWSVELRVLDTSTYIITESATEHWQDHRIFAPKKQNAESSLLEGTKQTVCVQSY